MRLFLNNIFKGLLVALLVITLGGFLYLNISKPKEINLKLISSSVVNQLGTESTITKPNEETENNNNKVLVDEDENEQIKEEKEIKIEKKEVIEENKSLNKDNKQSDNNEQNNNVPNNNIPSNSNKAPTPNGNYSPNLAVASTLPSLNTYYGQITAYGPDCVGCGGRVAHGEYVGGGNIYYNDGTFGNVRIVAGDSNLGFGTIVRISGLSISSEPILAIVLDTGGDIGFNKPKQIYFDLLYESESAASSFGLQWATFDILRYGF